MENNKSINSIVEKVQEICQVRQFAKLSCRGCKYYGKSCDRAIEILKSRVTKPCEITIIKKKDVE